MDMPHNDGRMPVLLLESAEVAEEAAAKRNAEAEYLRMAQEVAGLGLYFRNLKTGEAYWSDKLFEIRGFDPKDGVPSLEQSRSSIPDSNYILPLPNRPMVEPAIKEKRFSIVMQARHAQTNSEMWLKSKGLITFGADGSPETVIGAQMDITAEKQALDEIQKSEQRQRLLAREVDHRAKNILATVLAVVRLTRSNNIDEFRTAVENRVAALARAHSILADHSWAGATLRDLIQNEISAFDSIGRCSLEGPDVALEATQVQPLSLVLHELTTNAAKYGALSQPAGAIRITWSEMNGGGLLIEWSEHGCANLTEPVRLGFGSRLIAATLGHQIEGEIKTSWRPEGVLHRITLGPAVITERPPQQSDTKASAAVDAGSISGRRVLIVEDEALLGLSLEEMIQDAGCHSVSLARNVEEALSIVKNQPIDMALLDFNLGGETSLPVAHVLRSRGVPFTFLTGYNYLTEEANALCSVKFANKPYRKADIERVLYELAASGSRQP
jgi:two-component sensor histidine kinase